MSKKGILLFICIVIAKFTMGQEKENSFIIEIPSDNKESVFEKTLISLIKSDYFIVSTNKESGFIQCKKMLEDKRWISTTKGKVIHYNLLVSSGKTGKTDIIIQANLTDKRLTGTPANPGYFNEDLGVTDDSKYIEPIIKFLESHLSP